MSAYEHVTDNAHNCVDVVLTLLGYLLLALKADSKQESEMKIPGSWNGLDGPELAGELG